VIVILVTGATGHVGNVLVRELLAQGERVRALVLPGEDVSSLQGLNVERVEGNVLEPDTLDRALDGVEVVYHLAGLISILPGAEEMMRRVNVEGVRNVAHGALKAGVKRMVHISSVHAFKRVSDGVVVDERIPFAPDSPAGAYDRTKAEGTLAVLEAVRKGLDAVIVCPSGIIGPCDYLKSEMGQTIMDFTKAKLHFLVDGAYDFVDVRDVAKGLILAREKGRMGEAYILSGTRVKITQIKKMVQDVAGVESPELVVPYGLARQLASLAEFFYRIARATPRYTRYALRTIRDNSAFCCVKAQTELGYTARPLRETIADTIEWWKEHLPLS
jgi:dihydroflavonol-4-reductase